MLREPRATYRLQLTPSFGFDDVARVAPYLARLGVSHVYLSPVFQTAPGSTHGYDVTDPGRVRDELGGPDAFVAMVQVLAANDLRILLDIVPNHMATEEGNAWWRDVLANGPASPYARYFDIDWRTSDARLVNRVLVPILGDHYGRVLDAGEIGLQRRGGSAVVTYFDNTLPVAPGSLAGVLRAAAAQHHSDHLDFLADCFEQLPQPIDADHARRRHRDNGMLQALVARHLDEHPTDAAAVDDVLATTVADRDAFHELLEAQNFRLAWWRTASEEIDYRRFFDITTLAGLRIEDPVVFGDVHRLALRWVSEGVVHGLRVDHVDGLRDPDEYLVRLRDAAPDAWILVEKIVEPGEHLRRTWPVHGTTGYEFGAAMTRFFVEPAAAGPADDLYRHVTGDPLSLHEHVDRAKGEVLDTILAAELARVGALLAAVCDGHRRFRDFTRRDVTDAVRGLAIALPVYRTYVREDGPVSIQDAELIARCVTTARAESSHVDPELFDLAGRVMRREIRGPAEGEFVARLQQLTGPVMAKAAEDTVCYRYTRFVALNEVGGDLDGFGLAVAEVHDANAERARDWPLSLLATSTHDTKRSEDVRARLAVLSEMLPRWEGAVGAMRAAADAVRPTAFDDMALEYLLYQTFVGAHPLPAHRASAYALKAAREAKVNTSWTSQDEGFEAALECFVSALGGSAQFRAALEDIANVVVPAGRAVSLATTALKLTSPGVPDLYQGTEVWDLSLVDPDNRRPVDYHAMAGGLEAGSSPKQCLISHILDVRRRRPEAFGADGDYQPLDVHGIDAERVIAFVRGGDVVTVATRPAYTPAGAPRHLSPDTAVVLPPGSWDGQSGTIGLAELTGRSGGAPAVVLERA